MKKLSALALSVILFTVFVCRALPFAGSNNIEVSDLLITQTANKSFIQIGDSKNAVLKMFGAPLKVSKYYFETDDKNGEVVKYNDASYNFIAGKLIGFEITGHGFFVHLKGRKDYAAVGNTINTFTKAKLVANGAYSNMQYKGKNRDEGLNFFLNSKNIVTEIFYTDN